MLQSIEELNLHRESLKRDPNKPCITICGGTGCLAFGARGVIEVFATELKKNGLEDRVDVMATGCPGFCERGPIVVILPQKILYQQVAIEDIGEIISSTIIKEEVIDRLLYKDPLTGEKIIREDDIPFYKKQKRLILQENSQVDSTKINSYISIKGYSGLARVLSLMTPEAVIEEVKKSGLRGRGGAGFPTGAKWELCKKEKGEPKYIICNADEGDPGAFMDRAVLEGNPHLIIEGMLIAAYAIGAREGYIYVRAEYPLAVENTKMAIAQAEDLGLLGDKILGTCFSFHLKIKEGAGAFVCGEETALIASIEGKRGMPKPRPPFPARSGLFGKPTNINNVETFANIRQIILDGGENYAKIGTEKSKGTKIFALAGKINHTGLVEVPMGTTLNEVIFGIGGGIPKGRRFKAVQLGGPSGGCLTEKHLNIAIDYDTLIEHGAMMGSGGMIVMDESNCMVEIARFFLEFVQSESCGKCTPCRIGTKRMLEIVTKMTEGSAKEGDIERLIEMGKIIKDSSLCGLGQTAPNPVLSTITNFRDEYEEHIREKKCRAHVCDELYTAPCTDTCPVGIQVHSYVVLITEERFSEALDLIKEKNPFPSICGRVCHRPCETQCRRKEIDEPIALRALKRFVADQEMAEKHKPKIRLRRGERVAVIGGGPAGLACAYYLAKRGYQITIFEALETLGGMLACGIPNYRLPKRILQLEINEIIDLGVEVRTNTRVGRDIEFSDILKSYNAVFIGIGATVSQRLWIEGSDADGVLDGLEFLRHLNFGSRIEIGKSVAVIGGGDCAFDCARVAIRLSASNVTIFYPRSDKELSDEAKEALLEGVKIEHLVIPERIIAEYGKVTGVEYMRMKEIDRFDESGKRILEPIKDSRLIIDVDTVIVALDRDVDAGFLEGRLKLKDTGRIDVDKRSYLTSIPGVFSGGDAVTGPATVIEAIAAGNKAAQQIDKYLNDGKESEEVVVKRRSRLIKKEEADPTPVKARKERHIMPTMELGERVKGFSEVELGFTREMAISEAKRCLRCHERR
ncbi:MAG: NADH-quinone oxidoreductase subunit NuoF [bacterium]